MNYEELMAELGKSVGLEDFGPDENGLCELYGEEATVSFQYVPEADMVLTTGLVCTIDDDAATAQFFRTFLEANFMFQRTRGSTLSVDPETNAVMLSRYDRLDELTIEKFLPIVERFVSTLVEWKTWQPQGDAPVPASMGGEFLRI